MYTVSQEAWISSSHQVLGPDGAREAMHGHNWRVRVTVDADQLDERGMVIDLDRLHSEMVEVLDRFDHTHLNDLPALREPDGGEGSVTGERLAQVVCQQLADRFDSDHHKVSEVRVWMTDDRSASFRP